MKKSSEKVKEGGRNVTWEFNHSLIRDAYIKLIDSLNKKPTYPQVAQDSGLSETTVQKHVEGLEFEPLKHPLRVLSDDVLLAIYDSAIAGNVPAQKLWFQIVEGWSEKRNIEHSGFTPALCDLVKKYREQKNGKKEE